MIDKFAAFSSSAIDRDPRGPTANASSAIRRCKLPCQVGGGVRSIERAQELLEAGARRVILGSSLFNERGVNKARAEAFAEVLNPDVLVGAVDGKGGKVVIHGWKTPLSITPAEAAKALDPTSVA